MVSARPVTSNDTYNTILQQLMSIQKKWNTDRETANAELKALFWNVESICARFASSAWTYFLEGVKSLLSGAKQSLEDLIEYVITHQDELKAASVKTLSFVKDELQAAPARTVGFVSSLWTATSEFCKAIHGESLYEEGEDLSAKPKMN